MVIIQVVLVVIKMVVAGIFVYQYHMKNESAFAHHRSLIALNIVSWNISLRISSLKYLFTYLFSWYSFLDHPSLSIHHFNQL